MKTSAIVAGNVTRNEDGLPWSAQYQDLYHPKSGALAQTQRVFLAGNQLPARWAGRERFVVLETGFGLGHNFLATWDTWRRDPQRSAQLHFISIEKHPLTRADLAGWHCNTPLPDLAQALVQAWPPLTPNLHRLSFDDDAVQLLLCLGDVLDWLPELDASVDAFYLDGFSPARNPQMWQPRLYKAMARLAAPDAHVATWSAAQAVREGLRSAGFEVQKAAGGGGKRDITLARYAPSFSPRPTPTRRATPANAPRHALIVGGGLAGCAAAWALAQQGWHSTVLDRQAEPAQETSGNPAGLFHGIVNAQDGAHARFNRSAAFEARRAVEHAIAYHGVPGSVAGLLRLQNHGLGDRLGDELGGTAEMQAVLTQLGLPADYVQALDAAAATSCAGLPLRQAAWFYPGGGWVQPAGLARSFLQRAGALVGSQQVQWLGRRCVDRLVRDGQTWQLLDAQGALLACANTVVLANAGDALRLLNQASWPIESVRGQITRLPSAAWREAGLPFPTCPIAGSGYLLPEIDDHALFGASSQSGDDDARVRDEDHQHNTTQLEGLLGRPVAVDLRRASGRVGWRCMSIDRLPVIGAVPDEDACLARWDQARFVPRVPGLFVMTALGSRGITWAALGAQVLASCVSGAPMPVESSLLDAIDPARFVVRRQRGKAA